MTKSKKQNFKLRDNIIFGKSTENPMNKFDVRIVTCRKNSSKLLIHSQTNLTVH